ncbi:DUF6894 family protein [Methylobacterium sp. E-016]|uniref:DUF6894 family protein n=1 Tax=Methylobacterium sp. E-016 TaxID=2836556 RepID=UPI00391DB205
MKARRLRYAARRRPDRQPWLADRVACLPSIGDDVARYFFDIADGDLRIDETGTECADLDAVRSAAMQILPEIARFEIGNGDRHTFTVIARDVGRRPVFTTTLSLTGLWLVDR